MEIKNLQNNAVRAYANISRKTSSETKENKEIRQNTDKIEFDFTGSIGAAKVNIASSVEAEANTARIEELQKQYAGDNCPVNADAIATALIGE